jgi:signal transduction histidine kinase
MTTVAPWAVGVRELIARPAGRGRVLRLTAPAHGAGFWVARWAATAAAGFVAFIPVLLQGAPAPLDDVMNLLGGIAFAACGLVAWRRRPDSGVGRLLTLAGFGILLEPILVQLGSRVAVTLGALLGELWIALFAMLILTFVSGGRLTSALELVLVAAFVFGLLVMRFAVLLFYPDPHNVLLVSPDGDTATALTRVQFAWLAVASLAVVGVIAARWRSASRPRRRALLPSLAGCLCAVLYSASLITFVAGSPSEPLQSVLNAALLTVPAALLWGVLRSRLARGGLPDLFRELGTLRGPRLEAGLAKALGDPDLALAYRVPGERAYIDGAGRPVTLPEPGGRRTAAPIEREGRDFGMLVYDASLDDDPELVEAVAATAAVALDSQDRLAELRASRKRLVAAGDAERRRLERNLHDGAQQRLVAVALQLRMIQRRLHTDPQLADELLTSAIDELSLSLEELRELARGIHPAVLNHGLEAALNSLASRAAVKTTVAFDDGERLPEKVQLAAYFVACEALANVAKYAHATKASVHVSRRNGVAVVEISDDGVGGADETAGTGLQGLADRVAALDGTLHIVSPPGVGTVVTAELPCAS